MVKMANDTMDGDTTMMKGDTMNWEMPPCWSLDGNPDDDNEQSQLAMLCPFFITFLLYLCTYPGGDKLPLAYTFILFIP